MDGDANTSHSSCIFEATTEELQETIIPAVWLRQPTRSSSVMCLQAYKLSFDAIPCDKEYSSFALLLQSPLPEEAANYCKTLQLRHGKAVLCTLEPLNSVFLDHFQVAQAEQFQSALFSALLDRSLEQSETKEPPISDGSWYLLLPLKHNKSLDPSQDQEIDWNAITKPSSFEDSKHLTSMIENACPEADGATLCFSNGIINIEDVPGLLVETIHTNQLYCIIDMFTDLTADSPFPNDQYPTYADYFEIKYGYKLEVQGQRLLKARTLRVAHNFLLPRSREKDHGSKDAAENFIEADKSLAELPPELCRIKYFGFYEALVNAAVVLPSLLHNLEGILVAAQLHKFLSSQLPKESVVSVKRVLEALTTQKCQDSFSSEHLMLLGDSFLKYAIGCHLFLVHEEADEGFLSSQRDRKICNSSLYTLGSNLGLAGYIRDSPFDPKNWVGPCHPSKVVCDESKLGDLHGESSEGKEGKAFVTCNKRHRWMQRKTIADAVGALIGAYLEDGGEYAALSFMMFIGLEITIDRSQLVKVQSTSMNNLSLIKRIDIEALEELLSYSFKNKGLLIEAFTHASFINHPGKSYQRLEFLGDSVLDFLIAHHLYEEFNESKPGELANLRSTIVSNESFARIAIQYRLYKHLIENSAELWKSIIEFASYINTSLGHGLIGDREREKCPKVLGDIVESLSGAVHVDSGFDLSLVWKVFEPILQPLILNGNVRLHPVRELLEVCQKNHFSQYKSSSPAEGGRRCQYQFEIYVNNEVITGAATAKDKSSAERQAAADALAKLKVLGYIHPGKYEALGSLSLMNMGPTSNNEQSGKSKITDNLQDLKPSMPFLSSASNFNALANCADKGMYHTQDDKVGANIRNEKIEKNPGINNEPPFRGRPNVQETVAISVVDYEARNALSVKDYGKRLLSPMEAGQHGAPSNSPQATPNIECSTPSRLVADGSVWDRSTHDKVENCKAGGGLQQSDMAPQISGTGPRSSERNELGIRNKTNLNSVNKPGIAADPACIVDMAMQAASKGVARSSLYKACTKKGWKKPIFTCCHEEGPPHNKSFTYNVTLNLPPVGQVDFIGDSRRTTREAMDSAAAKLLEWLGLQCYL